MGHPGNYTREEAIPAIDAEGILPERRTGPRNSSIGIESIRT